MSALPTEPGYYWAKWKTPSGGMLYGIPGCDGGVFYEPLNDEISHDWEIVEVHDNNGEGDEKFSVSVFGVYPTQWPLDFFWGPKLDARPPV